MNPTKLGFTTPKNVKRWADMQALMAAEPITAPDMARALELPPEMVNAFLRNYRLSVFISSWRLARTTWTPVWSLGEQEDARRPVPLVARVPKRKKVVRVHKAPEYKVQPVVRDWSVTMLFGNGVNLNAELAGMRA